MSEKLTAGSRLVSATANKSASSTSIIPARLPVRKRSSETTIAGRAGIVVLLILASVGVVFTVKHRSVRTLECAPALPDVVVAQIATPATVNVNHSHSSKPIAVKPSAARPKPPAPRVNAVVAPTAPLIPVVVPAAPPVVEPEQLALLPRTVTDELIDNGNIEPMVARADKPSLEPTLDPKEKEPQVPAAAVENVLPKNDAAANLAATDVPPKIGQLQNFGTKIDFATDVATAFSAAKKDKNTLVLVITYAGSFKDGSFTSEIAEQFRKDCLMKDDVAEFLKDNKFICVMDCISGLGKGAKAAGGVVSYICVNDRSVLHAIAGPVDDVKFLEEVRWAMETRKGALENRNAQMYSNLFKKAHAEKFFAATEKDFGPMNFQGGLLGGLAQQQVGPLGPFPGDGNLQPFPREHHRLPPNRPASANPQTQIHWLLAMKPLRSFDEFSKTVYIHVMNERIYPK